MNDTVLAVSENTRHTLTIGLFLVFIAITLYITIWASRQNKTAADFYAGGRSFSAFQNGLAIGGDYMSAASFLGIAGIIALFGYDGFLYSIGFLVAWLVALLLVAELMRNSGRYTMGDVLAFRMRQQPTRIAAGVSTIAVSIFYLIAQMVGAGALVTLLLGIGKGETFLGLSAGAAKNATVIVVGALMIIYVIVGGMRGTTWVQIIKAGLLMTGALLMTIFVLAKFNFNPSSLLGAAADKSGKGEAFLNPGLRYGAGDWKTKVDLISLGLALVLGTAGLPHVLMRFYTVPTARDARRSVNWAIGLIGTFYLFTLALGFGAAALVGSAAIRASSPSGNTAAPQLAEELGGGAGSAGGAVFLAFIASVAFATILAVVAGLTLASSSSVAHDIYANVVRKGDVDEGSEVKVARVAAVVIGAVSIVLSVFLQNVNVAALVALAFALAASGNLPAILYSLFWRKFNTQGATWAIYGGLGVALFLVIFSPVVSGAPTSMISDKDFSWFPLENPGVISIPLGFFFGWLGTVLSRERDDAKYDELEVRSLTGAGAH
ncbi:MAG TPA: cation acetate symporter [Mycobacteriales bacterium]|nr:cation acetate symporter [Mycobacteriales bacterium]